MLTARSVSLSTNSSSSLVLSKLSTMLMEVDFSSRLALRAFRMTVSSATVGSVVLYMTKLISPS
ncbi:hypothetical protein Mp_8g14070 [Marchantia polymorpha subsp. ruderalis]|uniref:Uncharacterized protein n=1 Tax=Marchantia polymorpha TaxID=3197 RepID=A0A2R6WCW3_MARPO|nr:hypothetical protein MARPO_0108s0032 [Marchantia polymorpha]BBN19836.1 hypothetical protein Mp_8g14070 [Marchantia polymorpha subsp. ruderalis]|eukprot:PTQ31685.1 hypothetical protein MARPO_0108s0032 [Marchantia polymorpha]